MDGKKTPHIIDEMFSDSDKYREDSQRQATSDRSMLDLFKTCVMLLNTKNIVIQKHPAPTKLNKKRIKKGKQPLFTYHTLRLQLPGKRKKSNGKPGTGDNTTRLHLCRGHFKTYTDENPLFGKLTGRYWWQPHARGDKKQGVVMKDYVVETAVA